MFYTDDPAKDYERYDRKRQEWLDSLPQCAYCKEPIQDEKYFEIEGDPVHRECIESYCKEHYEKENTELEW